jgi:hypothetical protein
VNRDQVESQLSAMFDGELPAAECELLSRRLVRDEQLRATWSRYAVIGAALRAEPVAQVHPEFAHRVSAALVSGQAQAAGGGARSGGLLRRAVLGAGLAAGVAGAAIMVLRNGMPLQQETLAAYTPSVARVSVPYPAALATGPSLTGEPASYVVPPAGSGNAFAVPASLANYVVAHSEVSSPLVRRSLLSALVGNDYVQPGGGGPLSVNGRQYRDGGPNSLLSGAADAAQSDGRR